MMFIGDRIKVDLNKDKVIHRIDEPTFMTDRRREELRLNQDGFYYLHTNNDRENELIYTCKFDIDGWLEANDLSIN